ncbi:MAG: cation:proton antiporter [Nanoarchaeota archaeon]
MAQNILLHLSLIVAVSAIMAVIARTIKQPPIIAYLLAGVVVGPIAFGLIGPGTEQSEFIQTLAHIGVAFLLFIVGLSLDFRVLKDFKGVSASIGIIGLIITGLIGGYIAVTLGFSNIAAIYMGIALSFSSTVIVVKLLSDKKELHTLHGRIALGILIVQDIIAATFLMAAPLLQKGISILIIIEKIGLAIVLIIFIFACSAFMHKKLLDYLARSKETLLLFGIAWALILATLFDKLGFSLEMGALIAGISLASSKYTLELEGKMKHIRDFFMVLFFVFFGSQLSGPITLDLINKAIIFSIFTVIGKTLIFMIGIRYFGYTKKTNFLASSSLAQISEFSLILVLLGFTLGHLDKEVMSLMVLIALITIFISSYSISYGNKIFRKISPFLSLFEKKGKEETKPKEEKSYEIIIFGSHRLGNRIVQSLKSSNTSFAVIDYNPKAVLDLQKKGINAVFGDGSDKEFLDSLSMKKTKLVISTISDEEANLTIKEHLKEIKSQSTFIATAEQSVNAVDLYNKGIDYVIIPHHLGGDLMSTIIKAFKTDKEKYKKLGKEHRAKLLEGKKKSSYNGI